MTISVRNFHAAAEKARQVGGTVQIDGNKNLTVKGTSWVGRAVMWLKDRMLPGNAQARNLDVLRSLERSIKQEYHTNGNIQDYLERPQSLQQRSVRQISSRELPHTVLEIIHSLPAGVREDVIGGQQSVDGNSFDPALDSGVAEHQKELQKSLQARALKMYQANKTNGTPASKILTQDEFTLLFMYTMQNRSSHVEALQMIGNDDASALKTEAQAALTKIQEAGLISVPDGGDALHDRTFLGLVQSTLWSKVPS